MSTFLEILETKKKQYKFTVKLACSDVTDEMLDCLEDCLSSYELISAERFKKSPLQKNPLDFPRVENSEVFTSNIVTEYPCHSDMLEVQLSKGLKLPRTHIVVYSENDPRAAYNEENQPDGEYKPVMGTPIDPSEEEDASELGGQAQADAAVEAGLEARNDRRVDRVINDLSQEEAFDDATFAKADREGENVKSVFFGRNKER